MIAHFALYGLFLSLLGSWEIALAFFVVHQAAYGLYNSSVFASNHKGMPSSKTIRVSTSFASRS